MTHVGYITKPAHNGSAYALTVLGLSKLDKQAGRTEERVYTLTDAEIELLKTVETRR